MCVGSVSSVRFFFSIVTTGTTACFSAAHSRVSSTRKKEAVHNVKDTETDGLCKVVVAFTTSFRVHHPQVRQQSKVSRL